MIDEVLAELRRARGEGAELGDDRRRRLDRAVAGLRRLAERPEGRPRGVGERAELVEEARRAARPRRRGCAAPSVWSSATWPSAFIVGCSCSRKPGSSRKPAAMSPRRSAEACAVSLASTTKRPTSLRLAARSPTTLSALTVRSARTCSARPSVREDLVGLAQRRAGAADRGVEVVGVAGHAGAERADDEAQALAVGAAQDVVDEVGRDRRGRAADRDARARLELLLGRARAGSRRSTRRSATAGATRRGRRVRSEPKPFLSILKPTSACLVRLSSLMSVILPARTPATFRSPPWIRPKALSSWTQYLPLSGFEPAPVARDAGDADAGDERARVSERALHGPSGPSDASHGKSARRLAGRAALDRRPGSACAGSARSRP